MRRRWDSNRSRRRGATERRAMARRTSVRSERGSEHGFGEWDLPRAIRTGESSRRPRGRRRRGVGHRRELGQRRRTSAPPPQYRRLRRGTSKRRSGPERRRVQATLLRSEAGREWHAGMAFARWPAHLAAWAAARTTATPLHSIALMSKHDRRPMTDSTVRVAVTGRRRGLRAPLPDRSGQPRPRTGGGLQCSSWRRR